MMSRVPGALCPVLPDDILLRAPDLAAAGGGDCITIGPERAMGDRRASMVDPDVDPDDD